MIEVEVPSAGILEGFEDTEISAGTSGINSTLADPLVFKALAVMVEVPVLVEVIFTSALPLLSVIALVLSRVPILALKLTVSPSA